MAKAKDVNNCRSPMTAIRVKTRRKTGPRVCCHCPRYLKKPCHLWQSSCLQTKMIPMSQCVSNRLALPRVLAVVLLLTFSLSALSDDPVDPDKSDYSLFDPTPGDQMRSFSTDRPPKANSPYTVDAGHFQYETDIAVFGYRNTDGIRTSDWTILDPTFKLGLTNTIDAELQITPYESLTTKTAAARASISGIGDTIGRLKIKCSAMIKALSVWPCCRTSNFRRHARG